MACNSRPVKSRIIALAVKADRAEQQWLGREASSSGRIAIAKAALCVARAAVVHTDGGCEPNPGAGGWGVTIDADGGEIICLWSGVPDTTNNRMEMTAAIVALSVLPTSCAVTVFGDSQYLIKGMTSWMAGWKRKGFRRGDKEMPNADLWRDLDALSAGRCIRWEWVRGHNGHAGNERADGLATRGMREARG
jgi:ribonuclease HI